MQHLQVQYAYDRLPPEMELASTSQQQVRMCLFYRHMLSLKRLDYERAAFTSSRISTAMGAMFTSEQQTLQELEKQRRISRKKYLNALYPWDEEFKHSPEDDISQKEEAVNTMEVQYNRWKFYKENHDASMTLSKFMQDRIYERTDIDWG